MPDLNVSVSDPVSADLQAVCGAIKAASEFLCTPQGQALVAQWQKDGQAFQNAVSQAWNAIAGVFKGKGQ